MHLRWMSAFGVAGVAGAGCVFSPTSGESRCPGAPFTVQGFASAPGASLTVEAFNDDSGVWEPVAGATAVTGGTTFGGRTLYVFSVSVTLGDQHFSAFTPDAFASVRVREEGGALTQLGTYDSDGVGCVTNRVFDEGEDWFAAGFECRSDGSPVLSLVCIG